MKPHIITITVEGGCVTDATNLPLGVAIRIVDRDNIKNGESEPDQDDYHLCNDTPP